MLAVEHASQTEHDEGPSPTSQGEKRGTIRLRMVSPIWSVVAEIDEARLGGMECESIPCKALTQNAEDPLAGPAAPYCGFRVCRQQQFAPYQGNVRESQHRGARGRNIWRGDAQSTRYNSAGTPARHVL